MKTQTIVKALLMGLLLACLVLLLAGLLWWRKEEPSVPKAGVPVVDVPGDPAYEAAVQSELLDCSKAQGEEYVRLRDALVAKARANLNAFRSAVSAAATWEERVAGEIVMEYVLRDNDVKAFADWKPKARRMKTRDQDEPINTYGEDFAKHAKKAPMVLVESLWKGTNQKFRSQYKPISRANQQVVAAALGFLKERRAREVLEWFMLDLPIKGDVGGDMADSANVTAAWTLGKLGCPESVPALLAALEKGVYDGSVGPALVKCADGSNLPLLRKLAATSPDEGTRATASDLIRELEAKLHREGASGAR